MTICKGTTRPGFQRLIISSSIENKDDFTFGFDFTKADVQKLIQVAQEMEKKFEEVKP